MLVEAYYGVVASLVGGRETLYSMISVTLLLQWAVGFKKQQLVKQRWQYNVPNKKHLKNVGPIRHCDPPLHCHSPGVATIVQAACDIHDDDDDDDDDDNDNDNA